MRLLWALAVLATPLQAQEFAAAGVPRSLAAARDYPALFAHLEDNGIGLFFPTFQYVEYPALMGYGFETDFLPPCSPDDPAFKALRASTVQLILPGPLLYPDLPDALRQVLACAGGHVAAVSSFDEPLSHEVSFLEVAQLYEQVKMVAPALDVIMVHAPVPDDNRSVVPETVRFEYFESVRKFSNMADIVGFDIYPYPDALTHLGAPGRSGAALPATQIIAAYKTWLEDSLPEKRHLMVLQGFAQRDMYTIFGPEWGTPPSAEQLGQMVAQAGNSEMIIWWGQAALQNTEQAPWPDILRLTAE